MGDLRIDIHPSEGGRMQLLNTGEAERIPNKSAALNLDRDMRQC
jgi:hypothetical protein